MERSPLHRLVRAGWRLGAALVLSTALLGAASSLVQATWRPGPRLALGIDAGVISVFRRSEEARAQATGATLSIEPKRPHLRWFDGRLYARDHWFVRIPLWLVCGAALVPTVALFWVSRRLDRAANNCCVGCGYHLAGLESPGVCPECGKPIQRRARVECARPSSPSAASS